MKLRVRKTIALAALCLLMAGCAQTGPPLPPSLELPKPPGDLRAMRKGDHVTLSWSEPILTTDRQSVRDIGPTLVCRSLESEIAECGNAAAILPALPSGPQKPRPAHHPSQNSASQRPAPQTYVDALPASMQQADPSAEITYAVEVLNRNARGAGLSNRVHVPAIATPPPPIDLAADLSGDGVTLTWTGMGDAQSASATPTVSAPVLQHSYRIYRRDEASGKDAIAGEIPISQTGPQRFTDSNFEWEKTYLYRVTSVSIIKRAESEVQVEGDDTAPVRVVAHDVFPPSVPAGLQAAYSGEGQRPFIDLIWAPVTNADLAGYNVYRSETSGAAVEQMVKVNSGLVKSPSYRDSVVASGKTYTYSVSAIDVRGNESGRSDATSESVP